MAAAPPLVLLPINHFPSLIFLRTVIGASVTGVVIPVRTRVAIILPVMLIIAIMVALLRPIPVRILTVIPTAVSLLIPFPLRVTLRLAITWRLTQMLLRGPFFNLYLFLWGGLLLRFWGGLVHLSGGASSLSGVLLLLSREGLWQRGVELVCVYNFFSETDFPVRVACWLPGGRSFRSADLPSTISACVAAPGTGGSMLAL